MARVCFLTAGVAAAVVVCAAPAYAAAPPTTVSSLTTKPGSGQVTLTWTNPADADFGGVVVVWREGSPPASTAEGATVQTSAQSATVTGLANGTEYGFSVFTRNTADELSAPASVSATPVPAAATALTAVATPGTVAYGKTSVIGGTLRRADTGTPVPGATVDVWRRTYGNTTFGRVARLTTNASGAIAYRTPALSKNVRWYLAHPADPFHDASQTAGFTTYVRPTVSYSLSARTSERNVPVTVRAAVTPSHAGRNVAVQVKRDGIWRHVAYRTLSATSRMSFDLTSSIDGTRYYRVVMSAHDDHTTARSATFGIVWLPRVIRSGMSGNDVLAVERRLRSLRYDVGAVDGVFDYDAVHATMAFQKVNGLPVNGAVDARMQRRLTSPIAPRLRYSRSGAWIEADLTKQTLYYARDGVVLRILDISSGNNQLFTVDGETQRATTPTGSFRIFHKIDGLRVSRLGSLWRPAYFASGGFAIHGSGFVPAYPDSHGCIRITNPAMNRLFPLLTIGMPVYVYRS
jgi:lipoprotein-anchoring transpeptidase ErfK/SrfK